MWFENDNGLVVDKERKKASVCGRASKGLNEKSIGECSVEGKRLRVGRYA